MKMLGADHTTLDKGGPSPGEALSFLLIGWPAAILAISAIGMWLGKPVSSGHVWIGGALAGVAAFVIGIRNRTLSLAVFLCVLVVSLASWWAGLLYDLSYDGQIYHMTAVTALANGWNPIRHPTLFEWDPVFAEVAGADIFIEHYAKGAWLVEAAIYKATGNIEVGKSLNLVLMVATFLVGWSTLRRSGVRREWALGIGLALALNPVAIYQSSTFYIDGQMASLFTIFFLLSMDYLREPRPMVLVPLLCTLLLLVELKFTGLVYSVLLIFGTVLGALLLRKRVLAARYGVATSLLAVFAIGVIGYQPYVTNTLNNGNPFYPAVSVDSAKNIQWGQAPDEFMAMNRLAKLGESLFSKTGNAALEWKLPLTFTKRELLSLTTADTRYAGMGPLFGGALLLTLVLLFQAFRVLPKTTLRACGFALSLLLATILINPEAWWARLSPQLWLLPIVPIVAMVTSDSRKNLLAGLVLAVLLCNSFLTVFYNVRYSVAYTAAMNRTLTDLRIASRDQPIDIALAEGFRVIAHERLVRSGVHFRQVKTVECQPRHAFTHILKTCAL